MRNLPLRQFVIKEEVSMRKGDWASQIVISNLPLDYLVRIPPLQQSTILVHQSSVPSIPTFPLTSHLLASISLRLNFHKPILTPNPGFPKS